MIVPGIAALASSGELPVTAGRPNSVPASPRRGADSTGIAGRGGWQGTPPPRTPGPQVSPFGLGGCSASSHLKEKGEPLRDILTAWLRELLPLRAHPSHGHGHSPTICTAGPGAAICSEFSERQW